MKFVRKQFCWMLYEQKTADEKTAKAKAKTDEEVKRVQATNDKAKKATTDKQTKVLKEKSKADQKVQFAKDVKKRL